MNRILSNDVRNQSVLFIRSYMMWISMFLTTFFLGLAANPLALARRQAAVHHVARAWGKAMARLSGAHIIVNNIEQLYRKEPAIILSNHQSMLDIFVIYAFLNKQFRWMAKSSLFKVPVLGWAMTGAGYIPVERGDRKKALQSLFHAADQIKSGKSVVIFPEATIGTSDGGMIPFKKGAFILAKKSGVTIQPISMWGAHAVLPDMPNRFLPLIFSGSVYVYVHRPISPEEYAHMSPEELSEYVRKIIEEPILRHMENQSAALSETSARSLPA